MKPILERIERYHNTDREYAGILMTALLVIGEDELTKQLDEAEEQGKRLELTYPIPWDVGPSEPCGVTLD